LNEEWIAATFFRQQVESFLIDAFSGAFDGYADRFDDFGSFQKAEFEVFPAFSVSP